MAVKVSLLVIARGGGSSSLCRLSVPDAARALELHDAEHAGEVQGVV